MWPHVSFLSSFVISIGVQLILAVPRFTIHLVRQVVQKFYIFQKFKIKIGLCYISPMIFASPMKFHLGRYVMSFTIQGCQYILNGQRQLLESFTS